MKLTKIHLFIMIMVVLVLSTLGFTIKEYFGSIDAMENQIEKRVGQTENEALKEGAKYDPFSNSANNNPLSLDTHDPLSDNDYTKTIAGLEDVVVPGRGGNHHHDEDGNHYKKKGDISDYEKKMEKKLEKKEARMEKKFEKAAKDTGIDMSKYILKSEIVPPVCPKCPDSRTCPRSKPCPACPACARCPEPAFECKKVPNYSAISASNASGLLPMPRLNSFAKFN
jgi:predicted Holliday junction resolvase-like endonuclease